LSFDTLISKQRVQFLGSAPVVAYFSFRSDDSGREVGAECNLHMQQDIKALVIQILFQLSISCAPQRLIEHNKVHAWQALKKAIFDFTDDPGDFCLRIVCLDRLHSRDSMADITECGKSENADF